MKEETTPFTPGPWLTLGTTVFQDTDSEGGLIVAQVTGDANALLISAAPDMLSTLERVVEWLDIVGFDRAAHSGVGGRIKLLGEVEAVIRKARGEQ